MKFLRVLLIALLATPAQAALDWDLALKGGHRSEANRARDSYRHPRETLQFFGLEEGMTVLEVSPGGGWYTEVLAPLVAKQGKLYAAHYALNGVDAYYRNSLGKFLQKMAATPDVYAAVEVTQLQAPVQLAAAPEGSVDIALSFRNVHNWMESGTAAATLTAIFKALKPGGVFGLVQHRAWPGTSIADMIESAYVTEEHVLKLVREAGFELLKKSEINSNEKDTADHTKGVWSLPPGLNEGEVNREKYLAIGESDRMTMKFRKPE